MIRAIQTTTKRVSILLVTTFLLCGIVFSAELDSFAPAKKKTHCFFTPPQNWEIIDAHSLSPKVVIGFLKKSKKGFCPSMNLAVEPVHVTLSEYVQAVKQLHQQDRNTRWRDLGKIKTAAGIARLTEIDTKSKWGDVRMLQMMLVKERSAYVLTAAASKEDFANFYAEIKNSFSSFSLTTDLASLVDSQEKKKLLEKKIIHLKETCKPTICDTNEEKLPIDTECIAKEWALFKDYLIQEHSDLGTFWQLQLLQTLQEEIASSVPAKDA